MNWSAVHFRVLAEIASAASGPGYGAERAPALLEALRPVLHFDAAYLGLLDPARGRQVPLVCPGYETLHHYLDSPEFSADMERVGLFAADGAPLGIVAFNTFDDRPVGDDVCSMLVAVAPLIASAVDPLHTAAALASLVADATAGVILTDTGSVIAVPGMPGHRLLTGETSVVAAASRLLGSQASSAFLAADDAGRLLRVTVLSCPPQPPGRLRAVVLLWSPPPLSGLTRRELQVLGLLVESGSNAAIAAALGITVRTVTAHVERIMVKLDATSRMMAALRARQRGIYIPSELTASSTRGTP